MSYDRRRVVFTTTYKDRELFDFFGNNTPHILVRPTLTRSISFGLRFIKQNIPSIEILEYPTWEQFEAAISKGCDVLGLSFYLNDIDEIVRMVEYARRRGVKEIWAGNYGALTPGIEHLFDRVFVGYSETEIAAALGMEKPETLLHPPLVMHMGCSLGPKLKTLGILFTTRGCSLKCTFCQTPAFAATPFPIPLSSIERVLKYYKEQGIDQIVILDENFGLLRSHSEAVVGILDRLGLFWAPDVRMDFLAPRLAEWERRGMTSVLFGIESVNQGALNAVNKQTQVEAFTKLVRIMQKRRIVMIGYYIIGFENDTAQSIREDMKALRKLDFDLTQIAILTPFPRTPLWESIEGKYGIFEKDYSRFDTKHLVWNHPHIAPDEMRALVAEGLGTVYPRAHLAKYFAKDWKKAVEHRGLARGVRTIVHGFVHANAKDFTPLKLFDASVVPARTGAAGAD